MFELIRKLCDHDISMEVCSGDYYSGSVALAGHIVFFEFRKYANNYHYKTNDDKVYRVYILNDELEGIDGDMRIETILNLHLNKFLKELEKEEN